MARTAKDVEAYLSAIGRAFETTEDGTYLLPVEGRPPVVVLAGDPVVFSVDIGRAPRGDAATEAAFFRRLLELNASDLLYCAYGLRGDEVVLSAALELENLDLNEVEAVLSDIDLALLQHVPELAPLSHSAAKQEGSKLPMGVFARLAQLIQANLNDLISRSEDPEKMLNQVVLEMNTQLIQAKKQVAVAIADEKALARQAEQAASEAAEWERRAMLAVRQGDDLLAKEALARKKKHEDDAREYETQWKKAKVQVDQLKEALRRLNDKIEEAKRKKNVLIARKKRAEAQKAISETMSGLKDQSAFETFARLEQKIDRMEAEADAGAELAEEFTGDRLAAKFKELERTGGVEDDLAALKRKMGLAPAEPEPAPAPQVRVQAPSAKPKTAEEQDRDELAAALAEIEAEEARERERLKRLRARRRA